MNPRHPVLVTMEKFLDQLPETDGAGLLIGLSGGIDSTALTAAIKEAMQNPHLQRRVECFHLHHGFRGAEADRDARHSLALCRRWSIPLHLVHENLDLQWGEGKPSMETVARDRRRFHLEKIAHARQCRFILLAHHMEDQAETLLGNLLRGCGLRGLGGIHPESPLGSSGLTLMRPLLGFRKEMLLDYIQSRSIEAVEDSSNASDQHRRNRLRRRWIPLLEEESPELTLHLHHLAIEMQQRWQQNEEKLLPLHDRLFSLGPFTSFPPGITEGLQDHEITDLFRETLRGDGSGHQLNRGHLEALRQLTRNDRSPEADLPG